MRLLPGWLAAQEGRSFTLDGDASIRRRPVDRIAEPLRAHGRARSRRRDGRFPPFTVHGARLRAIDYELPVASAQVKSCVLLAGADGRRRDDGHRARAAAATTPSACSPPPACDVRRDGRHVTVANADELGLERRRRPRRPVSSAAFLIAAGRARPRLAAAAARTSASTGRAPASCASSSGWAAIVLGDLEDARRRARSLADEPVSDLDVAAGPLVGTTSSADEVPLAIDELPLVALLGCFAEGETVVRGAQELRVKESDRIAGVVDGLRGLGGDARGDRRRLRRARAPAACAAATIDSARRPPPGDARRGRRAGLAARASRSSGMEAAAVSYPGFDGRPT